MIAFLDFFLSRLVHKRICYKESRSNFSEIQKNLRFNKQRVLECQLLQSCQSETLCMYIYSKKFNIVIAILGKLTVFFHVIYVIFEFNRKCLTLIVPKYSATLFMKGEGHTHQPKRRIMQSPRTSILSIVVYIFDDREIRRNLS